MPEHRRVSFQTFVKGLSDIAPHLSDVPLYLAISRLNNLAKENVNFPLGTQDGEIVIYRKPQTTVIPDYDVGLTASLLLPENVKEEILQGALSLGKDLKLPKGQYEASLTYRRTADQYSASESELPPLWRPDLQPKNISVSALTSTRWPDSPPEQSLAKIEINQNVMTISANGEYYPYLGNIADALKAQFATLRFFTEVPKTIFSDHPTTLTAVIQRRIQLNPLAGRADHMQTWKVKELEDIQKLGINPYYHVINFHTIYSPVDLLTNRPSKDVIRAIGILDKIHNDKRNNSTEVNASGQAREPKSITEQIVFVDEEVRKDGSQIHRLQVPLDASNAKHLSFKIKQLRNGNNEFSIGETSPDQPARLSIRTEKYGSELSGLHEFACKKIGFAFQIN
jgi:hypothetical protein